MAYEAGSAELIVSLVGAGLAVSLLPPGIAQSVSTVVCVEAVDGPVRVEYAAWDQRAPRSVTRAFIALLGDQAVTVS